MLISFYRDLAAMYGAGVEIRSALRTLEAGFSNPALRQAVLAVQSTLDRGGSLSDGMRRFPNVFLPLHSALVEASETTGQAVAAFESIADYEEVQQKFQRRLFLGMVYPFFLLNLAILLPPLPDLFIVGLKSFLLQVGIGFGILYGALITSGLFLWFLRRGPAGHRILDTLGWHFPMVSGLVRRRATSRFLRVLATMHAAGISSSKGIGMAGQASGSAIVERAAGPAAKRIEKGSTLSESLAQTRLLSVALISTIRTGEQTGNLDESLERSAESLEREASRRLNLLSIVSPLFAYIAVGVFVAWKVISFWSEHYTQMLTP